MMHKKYRQVTGTPRGSNANSGKIAERWFDAPIICSIVYEVLKDSLDTVDSCYQTRRQSNGVWASSIDSLTRR